MKYIAILVKRFENLEISHYLALIFQNIKAISHQLQGKFNTLISTKKLLKGLTENLEDLQVSFLENIFPSMF